MHREYRSSPKPGRQSDGLRRICAQQRLGIEELEQRLISMLSKFGLVLGREIRQAEVPEW